MSSNINIKNLAAEYESEAIEIRRHLHQNPELSGEEYNTLEYIKNYLESAGIKYREIKDGGILGYIGAGKRTLLLRADIDALPIQENKKNLKREREVISQIDGVCHACGHDAHTAILLTSAKILKKHEKELDGNSIILLFERGEEGTGNLRNVVKVLLDENTRIDAAHAIHVRPDLPAGRIFAKEGPVLAGAFGFTVKLNGRGGHGSRPDLVNNPVDCFVAVYNALSSVRLRKISPFEELTFVIGLLQGGTKGNVIADELRFGGSARFYKKETGDIFMAEFKNILDNITAAYGCTYEVIANKAVGGTGIGAAGIPTVNNAALINHIRETVKKHIGEQVLIEADPLMGSESFSMIAELWPGAMINIGVGNPELGYGGDLHSEYFDLDESALSVGVAETVAFALEFARNKNIYDREHEPDMDYVSRIIGNSVKKPVFEKRED